MLVKSKRKYILLFTLSVIIFGLTVSSISNILFTQIYTKYSMYYSISITIMFTISIFIFLSILQKYEISSKTETLIGIYNESRDKFIDLPNSPSSVNARVLYNQISTSVKKKKCKNDEEKYAFLLDFFNCFIVQIIFSRIFTNSIYTNKVNIHYLKELLTQFRYLDIDDILGGEVSIINEDLTLESASLTLPSGFNIKQVNSNNLKIDSNYGFVIFEWNTEINPVISKMVNCFFMLENISSKNCIEFSSNLTITYGYKIKRIFMKSTIEFENFIKNCLNNMSEMSLAMSFNNTKIDIELLNLKHFKNHKEK